MWEMTVCSTEMCIDPAGYGAFEETNSEAQLRRQRGGVGDVERRFA